MARKQNVTRPRVKVIESFSGNECRVILTFGHSGKRAELILRDSFTEPGRGDFCQPTVTIYEIDPGVYVSLAANVPTHGGITTSAT